MALKTSRNKKKICELPSSYTECTLVIINMIHIFDIFARDKMLIHLKKKGKRPMTLVHLHQFIFQSTTIIVSHNQFFSTTRFESAVAVLYVLAFILACESTIFTLLE